MLRPPQPGVDPSSPAPRRVGEGLGGGPAGGPHGPGERQELVDALRHAGPADQKEGAVVWLCGLGLGQRAVPDDVAREAYSHEVSSAGFWPGGDMLPEPIFFSYAYVALDAGVGALILFGGVQITMFAGSILAGNRPSAWRWCRW